MEEVKLAIKPYYQKKDITKEEYKDILRKAVHKVGGAARGGRRQVHAWGLGRWLRPEGEEGEEGGKISCHPSPGHTARQSRGRGLGAGGDGGCPSLPRSATAKVGRSTR